LLFVDADAFSDIFVVESLMLFGIIVIAGAVMGDLLYYFVFASKKYT